MICRKLKNQEFWRIRFDFPFLLLDKTNNYIDLFFNIDMKENTNDYILNMGTKNNQYEHLL